jgi:protease I
MRGNISKVFVLFLILGAILTGNNESTITTIAKPLQDANIVTFIADGYDSQEKNTIEGYLSDWGATVTVAGLDLPEADIDIVDVDVSEYDCIFIPGGGSPALLVESQEVLNQVSAAYDLGLILAAICHGPLVLARAGVIDGRNVTGYWDIQDELEAAGGNYFLGAVVITDGPIITANWPYFLPCSIAIAEALGLEWERPEQPSGPDKNAPPSIGTFVEPSRGEIGTEFTIVVHGLDISVIAHIFSVSENNTRTACLATIPLEDEDGNNFHKGNFTPAEPGKYCVDLAVETDSGGNFTFQDECSFDVVAPTKTESSESPGWTFPLLFAAAIIAITLRKSKKRSRTNR